jgi:glycosyltransferase involved in cell wall biosynthesis
MDGLNQKLTVTVLVNTYNHEKFIEQALQSILDQDWPGGQLDIVVVDDGSTDSTFSIAQRFAPRMRCFRKPNGGQVSAFHAGVAEMRGEVVAFLDGDDWWETSKISKVVDAFCRFPNVAAIGHGFYEVDQQGAVLGMTVPAREYYLALSSIETARFAADLRVFGGTSRLTMRRSALERTLPVPSELPFFDNYIFTQAIAISGAVLLPEPLCYYRFHSANLYASDSADKARLKRKYDLQRSLTECLPPKLCSLGVPGDFISAALEADFTDRDRLRLILQGGWCWETFRVERTFYRNSYARSSTGYFIFKLGVLVMTLLLPPRTFYKLRSWYTRKGFSALRGRLGRATLAVSSGVLRSSRK